VDRRLRQPRGTRRRIRELDCTGPDQPALARRPTSVRSRDDG
jgi:hypothetical protein